METRSEMAPEATDMQQPCGGTDAAVLPRQSRTRQGRARLLTLDHLDQRTAAARAARSLVDHLTSDLGGDDQLSAGERELVKRAALCGAIVADFEARWVAGQLVELGEYLAAVNVQRRVLATLGLRRRARDVTPPSLREYLAKPQEEAAE
jgi:hypothetical protein